VSEIEQLVTVVDLDDRNPSGHSAWAHLFAVLRNGERLLLFDDRGWSSSAPIAEGTLQQTEVDARTVVGPDGPGHGQTAEQMEDLYWGSLVNKLRDARVVVEVAELRALPHEVEIREPLRSRLRVGS